MKEIIIKAIQKLKNASGVYVRKMPLRQNYTVMYVAMRYLYSSPGSHVLTITLHRTPANSLLSNH